MWTGNERNEPSERQQQFPKQNPHVCVVYLCSISFVSQIILEYHKSFILHKFIGLTQITWVIQNVYGEYYTRAVSAVLVLILEKLQRNMWFFKVTPIQPINMQNYAKIWEKNPVLLYRSLSLFQLFNAKHWTQIGI